MKFIEKAGKVAAILLAVIVLGLSFYIGYAIALNKYESMVGEKALASFMIELGLQQLSPLSSISSITAR